ncbi:MAG: HDIG domain-containing protein [Flavobacteriales bacterium]|nr:HDIG domain-containing protein [Flavobacteriales bacterium]MDG1781362.1 HDIG domain-containing protein [Flavobacteriales bacterium]MDG2246118.1 HDIG domain-containing protein [Flavobacteriales bacterium]
MAKFVEHIRDKHNILLVIALFAICLGTLMYLYPREAQFKYEYSEGKVWAYEDFISPYDINVEKLDDEVQREREAIRSEIVPVYRFDVSKEQAGYARMNFLIDSLYRQDSARFDVAMRIGNSALKTMFEIGVIDLDTDHQGMTANQPLQLIDGAFISEVKRSDVVDMNEGYGYLRNTVSVLASEELIDVSYLTEVITQGLNYNLLFDKTSTDRNIETRLNAIHIEVGELEAGELIIRKGEEIGLEQLRELESVRKSYEERVGKGKSWWIILLGQGLLISVGLISIVIILRMLEPDLLEAPSKVTFILVLIVLMALLVKVALSIDNISIYLVPICIVPIILRAFYDAKLALLIHIVNVFMLSFIVPSSFEFAFLHIFAGILLLYGMRTLAKRSQFFNAALVIFLSYSITYLGLNIIQEGKFTGIHLNNYAWFGGNAFISMFAFPLIYLFERSFGFLSEISLLEISDSNNDLLRELNEKAPGTFQHTLQVANLAEEAIREIGGNVLLMRAGALYHDIGKMEAPRYFTENQHGVNPHDDMGPEESARTIIHHVIKGIELARKNRLPEEIIDFIRTHHGTTRVEYFYRTAVNERGEEEVDETLFRYPGPMPFSRETAVLMMADSVEAASRSLPDYSEERIFSLIESIVAHQQSMGQFENADITFKEITKVKKVFLKKLLNIYHSRIAYPDSKK